MRSRSLFALFLLACSDASSPPDAAPLDATPAEASSPDLLADSTSGDGPTADIPVDGAAVDSQIFPDLSGDATLAFPLCSGVGGFCTPFRWEICPPSYEPVFPNSHQDCPSGGWCCVPAPPSTCSAAAAANCIKAGACTGCWGDAANKTLTCEPGRVCCNDICDSTSRPDAGY